MQWRGGHGRGRGAVWQQGRGGGSRGGAGGGRVTLQAGLGARYRSGTFWCAGYQTAERPWPWSGSSWAWRGSLVAVALRPTLQLVRTARGLGCRRQQEWMERLGHWGKAGTVLGCGPQRTQGVAARPWDRGRMALRCLWREQWSTSWGGRAGPGRGWLVAAGATCVAAGRLTHPGAAPGAQLAN